MSDLERGRLADSRRGAGDQHRPALDGVVQRARENVAGARDPLAEGAQRLGASDGDAREVGGAMVGDRTTGLGER